MLDKMNVYQICGSGFVCAGCFIVYHTDETLLLYMPFVNAYYVSLPSLTCCMGI
jgi:hypothetical protein